MSVLLKQSLPIPSEYAGAIIGKNGLTLDSILKKHRGVNIYTRNQNDREDARWTYFYIVGGTPSDHNQIKKRIISIMLGVCCKQALSGNE
tara:strand:+ start:222 stop:491 length:270 start_codon:yes stop_codon:yes gene_type:complete